MPDKKKLNLVLGYDVDALRCTGIPELDMPFQEVRISEFVQLRPWDPHPCKRVDNNKSFQIGAKIATKVKGFQNDKSEGSSFGR